MLFCHGTYDPLVALERGRQAHRAYARPERKAEWHEFPMGHEVSPAEIVVIREWLGGLFAAVRS